MTIRVAQVDDAVEIQSLIIDSVSPHRYEDFDAEGWINFLAPNQLPAIQSRLQSKDYSVFCYISTGDILGIISIFELEKIDQLFVLPSARKMGIAAALWDAARDYCVSQGNARKFWVRSSTLAVPVYESFGFKLSAAREIKNGITFYPMELMLPAQD